MSTNIGKVVQVIGPVVDILFAAGNLPAIYNAIHIKKTNEEGKEETIAHLLSDILIIHYRETVVGENLLHPACPTFILAHIFYKVDFS